MYSIELTGFFSGEFHHFHGFDLITCFEDLIEDSAGMSFTKGIRLDHGKRAVAHILGVLRREGRGYQAEELLLPRLYGADLIPF
jgi:hypothetical protein